LDFGWKLFGNDLRSKNNNLCRTACDITQNRACYQ